LQSTSQILLHPTTYKEKKSVAMESGPASFKPTLFQRIFIRIFTFVNSFVPWHKLPSFLGAFNLESLRTELRAHNLHDTYVSGDLQGNTINQPLKDKRFIEARHSDGKFNSLDLPLMGCTGMRFGRNFPRKFCQKPTEEDLLNPNPRLVSERFMARRSKGFIPATTLNLLAAAWIQFQTHDWFQHEIVRVPLQIYVLCMAFHRSRTASGIANSRNQSDEVINVPLPPGDNWPKGDMKLRRTKPDDILDPSDIKCPGYKNINTAWWDGSQIYGSSEAVTQSLRTTHPDGKLSFTKKGKENFLPRDSAGNPKTGFNDNWWTGMEMLHTLFALEHNALCDMLRRAHPDWTG
jgi:Animal haem peroxidase